MDGKAPLHILGETAYPPIVASARVRVANFVPLLSSDGVSLDYRPNLTDAEYAVLASPSSVGRKASVLARSAVRAIRRRSDDGLLFIHRLRLLNPVPGVDPPARLDVYDLDDALFLGSSAEVNRRFRWAKQEARRCIEYLERARLVTAGNPYLAGKARDHARRVEVVPTCVDPGRQPLRVHGPAEVANIGWIGSRTTSEYLKPLLPIFDRLNSPGLRARLIVVGGDTSMQSTWIEHRPWSLESEANDLSSFDIGIMPLPDSEWARGKCGYKVLQYFSAGVPAIGSPVGITPELIGEDRGLLASTASGWHTALDRLIRDAAERQQRGAAARAFVERNYSYQRWAPELASMLQSLAP